MKAEVVSISKDSEIEGYVSNPDPAFYDKKETITTAYEDPEPILDVKRLQFEEIKEAYTAVMEKNALHQVKGCSNVVRIAQYPDAPLFHYHKEKKEIISLIRMEYVLGKDTYKLRNAGDINQTDVSYIALDILSALESIAVKGVVHNDVSSLNIMYNPSTKRATLIDFGIASADISQLSDQSREIIQEYAQREPKIITCTPPYISPERTRMENPTLFSDVFSLGTVLFHLLTTRTTQQSLGLDSFSKYMWWMKDYDSSSRSRIINKFTQTLDCNTSHRKSLAAAIESAIHEDPAQRDLSFIRDMFMQFLHGQKESLERLTLGATTDLE